jgi:long-chain acyl-CoA synthetase
VSDAVDPLEQLTGEGGPFEIVVEDVLGHPTQVYKQRMHSLRELMAQNALRADVDWVVQEDVRYTFGEHDRRARVLAKSLADLGVQRGDRVALVSANVPEWVVTFWAVAILGATLVPLNAWWKAEELEFGLHNSESRVLIGDARRLAVVRDRLEYVPSLLHVFEFGTPEWDALVEGDDPGMPEAPIDEDDLLAICYTSGTTGQPKGATLTYRQVIANLQNIIVLGVAAAMRGDAPPEATQKLQSASLLVVPLFHVTGCLSTMTLNYATGGKLVLMPVGRFDPDVAMRIIEREKVTAIGGVPTIMWRILESPNLDQYDLSSVQRASYGGAPAAPELVERIEKVFPHMRKTLTTAYGLTETASVATAHGGDDYFAHPGSVGRAAPTVELRVVDDNGTDRPAGERGEIWIKGPTVMNRGYWRRPDANESSFSDGWFHTGDIGYLDAEGFLFLVDRAKDMIIRAGENVYCVEVENVLFDHPDVIDAAVVGVPHKTLGEEVKAVVQLREGATVTADELREFCAQHLANFKVPEYIEFRTEPLPRNPAGKVLKNLLRGGDSAFAASDDQAL